LRDFEKIPLDTDATWRAGMAFRQYRRKDSDDPVLPDLFIRAQPWVKNPNQPSPGRGGRKPVRLFSTAPAGA
jgi:hypothetical protein